jgi:hypothetical protein
MSLPIFQSESRDLTLLQTSWSAQLNPLLKDPLNNGLLLKSVPLASGSNVINHRLGRMLQGWYVVDINAAITIYRSAPKSALTLTLTASGTATVDLFVF